jgi:TonB family protein
VAPVPDKVDRKSEPEPDPVEPEPTKSTRAIGGFGGEKDTGVSVEVGDGSQEVNLDDVEFITYFKMVQAQISSRWVKRGLEGGTTRVRFFIHRDGKVTDVDVTRTSGKAYLDSPAKRAVLGADFPPLPQSYEGDKLIVNINFQYGER